MFIYHFSRLIKSKLLWGLLALLMVFAFVVADSCSGTSTDATVGIIDDTSIEQTTVRDMEYVLTALRKPQAIYSIPNKGYTIKNGMIQPLAATHAGDDMCTFWTIAARAPVENEEAEVRAAERHRWELLAARTVGMRNHFDVPTSAGEALLMTVFSKDDAFQRANYETFLMQAGVQAEPKAFEEAYANVWVPTQAAVSLVANSVAWLSPMERDFMHAAQYDKTTVQVAVLKNTIDPATLVLTEEDIQAWYNSHLDDYAVSEQREIAYVEIPVADYLEAAVVTDDDAMQYYEEHPEQFKGTNETETLPFLEVKGTAIAEMKKIKAMDDAHAAAQTSFYELVSEKGGIDGITTYPVKTIVVGADDMPAELQNAREVVEGAFSTDTEDIRHSAVKGTDRVYFMELKKIIPAHTATLETVRDQVVQAAQEDLLTKKLLTNGETAYGIIQAALDQGKTFSEAVAACNIPDFTAFDPVEFIANDGSQLSTPYPTTVRQASLTLGAGMLSKPQVEGKEVLFTYVVTRTPQDSLLRTTEQIALARSEASARATDLAKAWLKWNLDREPPQTVTGLPLLKEGTEE